MKVRTLVPLQHPTTGEQFAAGVEVDVADEVAADWRADGKVSDVTAEQQQARDAEQGNYSARTSREDAGGTTREETRDPKKK